MHGVDAILRRRFGDEIPHRHGGKVSRIGVIRIRSAIAHRQREVLLARQLDPIPLSVQARGVERPHLMLEDQVRLELRERPYALTARRRDLRVEANDVQFDRIEPEPEPACLGERHPCRAPQQGIEPLRKVVHVVGQDELGHFPIDRAHPEGQPGDERGGQQHGPLVADAESERQQRQSDGCLEAKPQILHLVGERQRHEQQQGPAGQHGQAVADQSALPDYQRQDAHQRQQGEHVPAQAVERVQGMAFDEQGEGQQQSEVLPSPQEISDCERGGDAKADGMSAQCTPFGGRHHGGDADRQYQAVRPHEPKSQQGECQPPVILAHGEVTGERENAAIEMGREAPERGGGDVRQEQRAREQQVERKTPQARDSRNRHIGHEEAGGVQQRRGRTDVDVGKPQTGDQDHPEKVRGAFRGAVRQIPHDAMAGSQVLAVRQEDVGVFVEMSGRENGEAGSQGKDCAGHAHSCASQAHEHIASRLGPDSASVPGKRDRLSHRVATFTARRLAK